MASERVRTRTARSGVKDTNSHMRPPLLDKKTANRPFPIVKSNGYNIFISFLSFESWVFCYFTTGQQLPCGSTPISQSRVIGGQDAKPGAWPWQVRITVQLAQQFNKRTSTDVTALTLGLLYPILRLSVCLHLPLLLQAALSKNDSTMYILNITLSCLDLFTSQIKF